MVWCARLCSRQVVTTSASRAAIWSMVMCSEYRDVRRWRGKGCKTARTCSLGRATLNILWLNVWRQPSRSQRTGCVAEVTGHGRLFDLRTCQIWQALESCLRADLEGRGRSKVLLREPPCQPRRCSCVIADACRMLALSKTERVYIPNSPTV